MIWFTSDTHFGHRRIIELSNRPFKDITHMNEMIVRNWNKVVDHEDTVFHLGDVALGPIHDSLSYIRRLNGTKILVLGNHDRPFMVKEKGQEKVDEWTQVYRDNGFAEVAQHWAIFADGVAAHMSHFPYDGDSHDGDRFEDERLPDDGMILIHGHTHKDEVVSRSKKGTLQIHVGVDAWDFRPVSLSQIKQVIADNS